jgi:hypothetical protein
MERVHNSHIIVHQNEMCSIVIVKLNEHEFRFVNPNTVLLYSFPTPHYLLLALFSTLGQRPALSALKTLQNGRCTNTPKGHLQDWRRGQALWKVGDPRVRSLGTFIQNWILTECDSLVCHRLIYDLHSGTCPQIPSFITTL